MTTGVPSANLGPYNIRILEGGIGVARPSRDSTLLAAGAPWSIGGWMGFTRRISGPVIIAAIGEIASGAWRPPTQ